MTEQELEELYGKGWSLSELWEEGNFGTGRADIGRDGVWRNADTE